MAGWSAAAFRHGAEDQRVVVIDGLAPGPDALIEWETGRHMSYACGKPVYGSIGFAR